MHKKEMYVIIHLNVLGNAECLHAYEHSYAALCGKTINQTMIETLQLGQLSETYVLNQANYIFITAKQNNNYKQHDQMKQTKKYFSSNLSALYKQRTLSTE